MLSFLSKKRLSRVIKCNITKLKKILYVKVFLSNQINKKWKKPAGISGTIAMQRSVPACFSSLGLCHDIRAIRITSKPTCGGWHVEGIHQIQAAPIRARTGPGLPGFPFKPAWFSQKPAWFRINLVVITLKNNVRVQISYSGRSRKGSDREQAGSGKHSGPVTSPDFPLFPGDRHGFLKNRHGFT